MRVKEKRVIECIVLINSRLEKLQKRIENEQEKIVADLGMPAKVAVQRLVALDNRRIDLCNLHVLYTFIMDGAKADFPNLAAADFYQTAKRQIELAGYTIERCEKEFSYLFDALEKPIVKPGVPLRSKNYTAKPIAPPQIVPSPYSEKCVVAKR